MPVEAGTSDEDWPDYLSNGLIKDFLGKIKSFHTFLIADSCFSGSLFIDKSREKFTGDRRDTEPSRWGLTSGKKEVVSDGRPGQHSPFAAALLDVLRRADAPLGVMHICDRVLEKVLANEGQTPMGSPLQVSGHQGGQMVLYLRQNEDADWSELQKEEGLTIKDKAQQKEKQKLEPKEERAKPLVLSSVLKRAGLGFLIFVLLLFLGVRLWDFIATQNSKANSEKTISDRNVKVDTSFLAPEMVLIPAGSFKMGSYWKSDEEPVHEVQLDSFLLAKYEVTVAEFKKFIEDTGYQTDADKDDRSYAWDGKAWTKMAGVNWKCNPEGKVRPSAEYNHPVIHVSWNDATEYAKWLSKKMGLPYRLPTEAEWEYAAGNGSKHTTYSWGNSNPAGKQGGNVADGSANREFRDWIVFRDYYDGFVYTAPVGSFNANELGLNDMSGNVWEWCKDWYGNDYYSNSPESNPTGPTSGSYRVCRGGSWLRGLATQRVAYRNCTMPSTCDSRIGFRLARQQ